MTSLPSKTPSAFVAPLPQRRTSSSFRLPLVALLIFVLYAGYNIFTSDSLSVFRCNSIERLSKMTDSATPTSPIDNLDVTLSQSSTTANTVVISVTNKNPHPITILSYESPLDALILGLGYISITPEGASEPIEMPILKASRLWPPPTDSFIEIAPGHSSDKEITLSKPKVPMEKLGDKATLFLRGRWIGVWPLTKSEITDDVIKRMHETAFTGPYESNKLELGIGSSAHLMRKFGGKAIP